MAKMFTITAGLENMGALSTGGQGSVYKAKRTGEIIVAVKLLPTPIHIEGNEDKNYRDFINEVEKLKKVNEEPNPHVVKILNSGITESGSLPFIEMEFIEGPDLGELLQPPHVPVFAVAEIIKVADQLANALNHCHQHGIRHGDLKSNNVKWNSHTGNYILLDFGLAVMSDEQRRSSLQHAGAVEFMAPEQSEGVLLLQSDVYSYGIILYELLAGTVPYPITDNGHAARSMVMVSHLEKPLPDPLQLRRQNLPSDWPDDRKEMEMQVPEWLIQLIFKCLEKDPARRFANGAELYQTIIRQKSAFTVKSDVEATLVLQSQNEQLQAALALQQEKAKRYEQDIQTLKQTLAGKEQELATLKNTTNRNTDNSYIPPQAVAPVKRQSSFWPATLILLALCAIAAYFVFSKKSSDGAAGNASQPDTNSSVAASTDKPVRQTTRRRQTKKAQAETDNAIQQPTQTGGEGAGKLYTLSSKYAYFHNSPDPASVRKANINIWNNARLTAIDEQNGYIYVVYKNERGQVSKGWLNKKDLKVIE